MSFCSIWNKNTSMKQRSFIYWEKTFTELNWKNCNNYFNIPLGNEFSIKNSWVWVTCLPIIFGNPDELFLWSKERAVMSCSRCYDNHFQSNVFPRICDSIPQLWNHLILCTFLFTVVTRVLPTTHNSGVPPLANPYDTHTYDHNVSTHLCISWLLFCFFSICFQV